MEVRPDKCDSLDNFLNTLENKRTLYTPNGELLKIALCSGDENSAFVAGLAAAGTVGYIALSVVIVVAIGLLIYYMNQTSDSSSSNEETAHGYSWGFDSAGSLTNYGEPIPLIYGRRFESTVPNEGNPFGGVRVGGKLINSLTSTYGGKTFSWQLFTLSTGNLGAIDPTETYVNDTDISDYYTDIEVYWQDGTQTTPMVDNDGNYFMETYSSTYSGQASSGFGTHHLVDTEYTHYAFYAESLSVYRNDSDSRPFSSTTASLKKVKNVDNKLMNVDFLSVNTASNAGFGATTSNVAGYNNPYPVSLKIPVLPSDIGDTVGKSNSTQKNRTVPYYFWEEVRLENSIQGLGASIEWEFTSSSPTFCAISHLPNIEAPRRSNGAVSKTYVADFVQTNSSNLSMEPRYFVALGVNVNGFDNLENATEKASLEDYSTNPDTWIYENNISFNYDTSYVLAHSHTTQDNHTWVTPSPPFNGNRRWRFRLDENGYFHIEYASGTGVWTTYQTTSSTIHDFGLTNSPFYFYIFTAQDDTGVKNMKFNNSYTRTLGSASYQSYSAANGSFVYMFTESDDDATSKGDVEQFSAKDLYRFVASTFNLQDISHECYLTDKLPVGQFATFEPLPLNPSYLALMSDVYRIHRAKYNTNSSVTSVSFNLQFILYARYKVNEDDLEGASGGKK